MSGIFTGNIHTAQGASQKQLPLREPLAIDKVGKKLYREEIDALNIGTYIERVMYFHSDCESGMGTEPMLRRLVWPWSLTCAGCEDIDAYLDAPPDKRFRKVTSAQVAEIRERVAAGERQIDVATEYGITPTNVNKIVKNKAWVRK